MPRAGPSYDFARPTRRIMGAMIPWQIVDVETSPGGTRLELARRGDEWEVRADRATLMSSRAHGSEDQLARLAFQLVPSARRILLGGLGLGFSLRAVLDLLPPDGEVVVAEMSPAVVRWSRTLVGFLAGDPLADPRVRVFEGDVRERTRDVAAWDAILLDVDNGPSAFVHDANAGLYTHAGAHACYRSLRAPGVLVVWSLQRDEAYLRRLRDAGFAPSVHLAAERPGRRKKHVLIAGEKKDRHSPAGPPRRACPVRSRSSRR